MLKAECPVRLWGGKKFAIGLLVLALASVNRAGGKVERLAEGVFALGARGLREPFSPEPRREQLVRQLLEGWWRELPRERLEPVPLGNVVLIDARGYGLACWHLMERAEGPIAWGQDSSPMRVELVAADVEADVALVQVQGVGAASALSLVSGSVDVVLGAELTIIGRDVGGRPRALWRRVSSIGVDYVAGRSSLAHGLILLDGPIPAGWDGGAVVDEAGRVAGLALGWSLPGEVMGYAVAAEVAERGLAQAVERLRRGGWLGVTARSAAYRDQSAAYVEGVAAESPAEKAGIAEGDLVVGWEDRAVPGALALALEGLLGGAGDRVSLSIVRDGNPLSVQVTLAQHPAPNVDELARQRLGLLVQELTRELALALEVAGVRGVVVVEVEPGGPAQRAGLRSGDVILKLAERTTPTLEALGEVLDSLAGADRVPILIRRGRQEAVGRIRVRPEP